MPQLTHLRQLFYFVTLYSSPLGLVIPGGKIRSALNNRKANITVPSGAMEFKFTLEGSFELHELFSETPYINYKVFSQINKQSVLNL